MKKTKLLMPLAGVAALGAITPIVMTATSCGNKVDSSIAKIEAETTKTSCYVGETIKKEDIKVTVIFTDQAADPQVVSDWTCDDLGDEGYHFSKSETKEFVIKYHGHQTKLAVKASLAGAMVFDNLIPPTLAVGGTGETAYGTEAAVHVYGVNVEQQDPHEIEAQYLDITSSDPTKVEYNAEKHTLVAKASTTGSDLVTITAKLKGVTEKAYETTMIVNVSQNQFISDASVNDEGGATVKIINASSTSYIANVPEYVKINGKDLLVTEIVADDNLAGAHPLQTIALPSTITKITGKFGSDEKSSFKHVYTILFDGTAEQWNSISCEDWWAGHGVTGAWCFGGEEVEFVNFVATHDAEYVAKSEEVENPYFKASMTSLVAKGSHTVGFDMVLAHEETAAEVAKYQVIDIVNTGLAAGYLDVDGVYVNGIKWTRNASGGANTYKVEGGRHNTKITLDVTTDPTTALTLNDRVVVTFSSPLFTASATTVTLEKATA